MEDKGTRKENKRKDTRHKHLLTIHLLITVPNVQVSDTTGDAMKYKSWYPPKVGQSKIFIFIKTYFMQTYDTLVDALNDLKQRGYTTDFNIAFDHVKCIETGVCLAPSQFEITDFYRFEGMTNPDDSVIVYTIEAKDGSMKGTLVSAYGVYSDPVNDEMLQKLSVHHN